MNLASALRSIRLNLSQVSYGWSRVHFLFSYGRGIWFFLRCFIFPLQEGWPYLVNLPFWQVSYRPLHAIFLRGKKLKVYEHQQGLCNWVIDRCDSTRLAVSLWRSLRLCSWSLWYLLAYGDGLTILPIILTTLPYCPFTAAAELLRSCYSIWKQFNG